MEDGRTGVKTSTIHISKLSQRNIDECALDRAKGSCLGTARYAHIGDHLIFIFLRR